MVSKLLLIVVNKILYTIVIKIFSWLKNYLLIYKQAKNVVKTVPNGKIIANGIDVDPYIKLQGSVVFHKDASAKLTREDKEKEEEEEDFTNSSKSLS